MPQIPRFVSRRSLQSQAGAVRGGTIDFGGGAVGKAMSEFGDDLTGVAEELIAIQEDRRDRDDAMAGSNLLGDARVTLTESLAAAGREAEEGAPDFAKNAREIIDEVIRDRQERLSPQAQETFAARFAKLRASKVEWAIKFETKARAGKQARDLAGAVDLQLNAIRSDPGQFNAALGEAQAAIAASGLPAESRREQLLSLRDRAARMYFEALSENDPLAAEAALAGAEFDGFLTPETKNYLVNNNKVELRRREAQLKAMERETEGLVARQVADAVFVISRGRIPPSLADTKQQAARFPDLARTLDYAMQDAELMAEFLRQPPAAQAADIEALTQRREMTRREVARLERMRLVHAAALKALQTDPLGYAAEIEAIEDLQDLDFAEPATLARRKVQADAAAAFFEVPVPLLRPAEALAMTRALDDAEGDQIAALFQSLAFGFGSDSFDGLADQIAPQRPAIAVALARAEAAPLVASEIVRGVRLLRSNSDVKPSATERELLLAEVYGGGLFREVPDALRHFEAAGLALCALHKVSSGDLSFDGDLLEDALRLAAGGRRDVDGAVLGGPIEFNGQLILPPRPGMDEDEFEDLVESLTPEELARFGNGAPLFDDGTPFTAERFDLGIFEPGDDAQLLTVGSGIYRVFVPGLGYVVTDAGPVFELDLRRLMRAREIP